MFLSEIAAITGGRLYGRARFSVRDILPPEDAGPSDLAFVFEANTATRAGAVVARQRGHGKNGIVVKDPRAALYKLLKKLSPARPSPLISDRAVIGRRVRVAPGCRIDAFAVIADGVHLGFHTWIGSHASIAEGTAIGRHCAVGPQTVIQGRTAIGDFVDIAAGCVIGKPGFGYIRRRGWRRLPHIGGVRIGDRVEIGAGTVIDRGTIGETVIGAGTKIDNLVHIGHNVKIGRNCLLMGQVGIAGSSVCEDNVVLCGQVGVSDHVRIGRNAVVYAKSAVFKSIPPSDIWSGIPARPHQAVLKALSRLYRCRAR